VRGSHQIRGCHLERVALIYLRQSSMTQVRENTESTARQYALAEVAVRLGWAPSQVFPPMENPPPGYITRIAPERIGGVGPWRD
jgi:hypothetical protein